MDMVLIYSYIHFPCVRYTNGYMFSASTVPQSYSNALFPYPLGNFLLPAASLSSPSSVFCRPILCVRLLYTLVFGGVSGGYADGGSSSPHTHTQTSELKHFFFYSVPFSADSGVRVTRTLFAVRMFGGKGLCLCRSLSATTQNNKLTTGETFQSIERARWLLLPQRTSRINDNHT